MEASNCFRERTNIKRESQRPGIHPLTLRRQADRRQVTPGRFDKARPPFDGERYLDLDGHTDPISIRFHYRDHQLDEYLTFDDNLSI